MNSSEDDDVKLQRAAASRLSDLKKLLPRILWKKENGSLTVRRQVREHDMYKVFALIEPFQEDPQLLDSRLKTFIPPLVDAYLALLGISIKSDWRSTKGVVPVSHAICQILNLFCKVRGEKVIKGFLNNEPRYLELILSELEVGRNYKSDDNEALPQFIVPWTERYVLLLWLSHLMLAPFPLESMSRLEPTQEFSANSGIELPTELPDITLRVLSECHGHLGSASKERGAAANLLIKLCVRPDMQKIGLLRNVVEWALTFFSEVSENSSNIHLYLGILSFLSGLVSNATKDEIGPFLPAIYQSCQNIITRPTFSYVKSSAVARKLVIKTLRTLVVHCLQTGGQHYGLNSQDVLEETIQFLIESVGDGDTIVRYAASKSLSIITMKLDYDWAGEVVNAIIDSLEENVFQSAGRRNLNRVDPLQWHGLTLTLSHLLYRKALDIEQLPKVINALLVALSFEQRAATGSIGTNVRDAACFGIWALARRYRTEELHAIKISSVKAAENRGLVSLIQVLACELVVVACLDPAGNIRRGSSAALQELIGRHPNEVQCGISLVQIVDFHAVGLRDRAMCEVSIKASKLDRLYWEPLFNNLLTWRGTGSLDEPSRRFSARAVGLLSVYQIPAQVVSMADIVHTELRALKPREVEERQGLVLALAALADQNTSAVISDEAADQGTANLSYLWELLRSQLNLDDDCFKMKGLRPDLTASSICTFIGALADMTFRKAGKTPLPNIPIEEVTRLLNLCLERHGDSVHESIPRTTLAVLRLLGLAAPDTAQQLVEEWQEKLERKESYNGLRWSGFAIALGAAYPFLNKSIEPTAMQVRIVEILAFRCTPAVEIQPRTVALIAINVLLQNASNTDHSAGLNVIIRSRIADALHTALNDYTVTERGDVGSLVRLQALDTIATAWEADLLRDLAQQEMLHADVLRLSLEKIDKSRLRAAHVLEKSSYEHFEIVAEGVADGVSSYAYFANALTNLQYSTPELIQEAFCIGFVTSAGLGSESVIQNARAALLDTAETWHIGEANDPHCHYSLLRFATHLLDLLKKNLDTERVLLPLLEVFAFLFDMQVLQQLSSTSFNFRALLANVQKAHFKSTHIQKLHLALDVYRGLATVPAVREETLKKLTSMLLHPFPKIRISAAETLWILTQDDGLKMQDWGVPPKSLRPVVDRIKAHLSLEA